LGIIFGHLIVGSPYGAVFFTLAFVLLLSLSKSPLKALSIFIFVIPFSGTTLFPDHLINLPGAKPLNFLALFVIVIAILNYKKSRKMPHYAFLFTSAVIIIFSISILRSMPHLDMINYLEEDKLSTTRYLLSDFVKPLIYFMPSIIVLKFIHKSEQLEYILSVIVYSMAAFSCVLLFFYIKFPSKGNLTLLTEHYSLTFGMHRNDIANFYIVSFPVLIMTFFLRKDFISILSICLSVMAIGVLMSRTAYFVLLFSYVFYFIISKRSKVLPLLIAIAIGLSLIISSNIMDRAKRGFDSKNIHEISAGRTDNLWIPLIDEYTDDVKKLIFGNGRYATVYSEAAKRGQILEAGHPHNMYLEQLVDAGLIGLTTFILFFVVLLKKLLKSLRTVQDKKFREYHYALLTSLIGYLVAGLSGRFLFPTLSNSYFWIIVGLSIVIISMSERKAEYGKSEA
jgi:O-antigen ligase